MFAGLTRMGLLALGLVWPPWIPAVSRLRLLCWSPSTAMAPGHQPHRESKCPQIFTDRAMSELNGFHWIIQYSLLLSPTNNVSLPPTWQDHYWAINRNNNSNQIRKSVINPFTFPRTECARHVRQTGVIVGQPTCHVLLVSMHSHCIFCQLRLSQARTCLEVVATLYLPWYESSFQEPNFHVMRL